jgi:putative methionine-R-sulfoxide reductase with GAF domain
VSSADYRGALEAVDRILNRGGDADDVLRAVVDAVHERVPHYDWVGISFVEEGDLVLGPWAGVERLPDEPPPVRVPIRYQGSKVGELGVDAPAPADDERVFLERLALLVSAHCLVGWDTGGMTWAELGG